MSAVETATRRSQGVARATERGAGAVKTAAAARCGATRPCRTPQAMVWHALRPRGPAQTDRIQVFSNSLLVLSRGLRKKASVRQSISEQVLSHLHTLFTFAPSPGAGWSTQGTISNRREARLSHRWGRCASPLPTQTRIAKDPTAPPQKRRHGCSVNIIILYPSRHVKPFSWPPPNIWSAAIYRHSPSIPCYATADQAASLLRHDRVCHDRVH